MGHQRKEEHTVKEDILTHKAVCRPYHHVHAPSGSAKLLLQSNNHRQYCQGEEARATGVHTNPELHLLLLMPDLGGEGNPARDGLALCYTERPRQESMTPLSIGFRWDRVHPKSDSQDPLGSWEGPQPSSALPQASPTSYLVTPLICYYLP